MPILDVNVIIRFVTRDQENLARRAVALFERLQRGAANVTLPEAVLSETVYVLSSKNLYNMSRDAVRSQLVALLNMPGVHVLSRQTCLRTLDIFVDYPSLSFVDALCVAYAEEEPGGVVLSFDRDFRRVNTITWEEP